MTTFNNNFLALTRHLSILLIMVSFSGNAVANLSSKNVDIVLKQLDNQTLGVSKLTSLTQRSFGEAINLSNGAVKFSRIDGSILGNSNLEVAYKISYNTNFPKFIGWTEDIPRIELYYGQGFGATSFRGNTMPDGWSSGHYCSGSQLRPSGTPIHSRSFDTATSLIIPGVSEQPLLKNNGSLDLSTSSYPYVTKDGWRLSCYTSSITHKEGFKATSINGDTYFFEKLGNHVGYIANERNVSRSIFPYLLENNQVSTDDGNQAYGVPLALMVTRIEDKFGNWVKFEYDSQVITRPFKSTTMLHLSRIYSSDNREIIVEKTSRGKKMTSASKVWEYYYEDADPIYYDQKSDFFIKQPDNKLWTYDVGMSDIVDSGEYDGSPSCYRRFGQTKKKMKIYHPNGSIGTFDFDFIRTDKANIYNEDSRPAFRRCKFTFSLKQKTIQTRINTYVWKYEHSNTLGHFANENAASTQKLTGNVPSNVDRVLNKKLTITNPNASTTSYFINRDAQSSLEGSITAIEQRETSNSAVLEEIQYKREYSTHKGELAGQLVGNKHSNNMASFSIPIRVTEVRTATPALEQHSIFYERYSDFNLYDVPAIVQRTGPLGDKYEKREFLHDVDNWVLNLPMKTSVSDNDVNYSVVNETKYQRFTPSSQYLPSQTQKYGKPDVNFESYHSDGNLQKVSYSGSKRYEQFDDYYRGRAQKITFPCSASYQCDGTNGSSDNTLVRLVSLTSAGNISSVTDMNGNKINYTYNSMGWLTGTQYVDPKFSNSTVHYSNIVSNDDNIPGSRLKAGMLRQTVLKGLMEERVYYDAMLRPVYKRIRDKVNNSTIKYQRFEYDHDNRLTFKSVLSDDAGASIGVNIEYDALGRVVGTHRASDDSRTTTQYLSGNALRFTDAEGNFTETSFLAYGQPSYAMPIEINAPDTSPTNISYNQFGNITAISQGSVTETRLYDDYQQLCKTYRPETGVTAYGYDNQRQLRWKAEGTNGGHSSCSPLSVPESDKVLFSYDNLDQLKSEYYFDLTPSKKYLYDGNGNLVRLTATSGNNETMWHYEYNSMNQVEKEVLLHDGKIFALEWIYNNVGDVASLIYPSGRKIDFNPNALGQPQQVSYGATNYVSNVKYYPNGTLKSVNYGNGIKRDVSLDLTGRISGISDSKGTKDSLRISSSYDQNDNLSGLTDWLDRNNNIDNISYDGLDRLLTADGRWGRGQYRYDGLGNIVSRSIHGSTINYSYNHLNQLNNITGGYRYNYAYDSRGNVIHNGRYDLVFNDGNQVISAKNITYQYDGHNRRVQKGNEYTVYSQSGQLLARLSPSNVLTESIYLDNKLIAETTHTSVRYQHTDMLSTPVLETDSSGNTLTKSFYEPFGKRLGGEKAGIGYTGHLQDEDLGLTYMQARYYDPLIGRFYSNDPIGFRDIHSFNRYAYGNNNPYKYTDPDGKAAESWLYRPGGVSIQQHQDAYTGAAAIAVAVWTAGAASVSVTTSASITALEVTAVATGDMPLSPFSRVNAVKLEKQLASQSQLTDLTGGAGNVISQPAKQANRIASQTGFKAKNIQKVSSDAHVAKDGSQVQTHTFRDAESNTLIEPKTIINETN